MVVRQDVAVLRDEKARAARGGLHALAKVVGCGGNVDRNDAVDVRGVDLRHRHLRLAVDLDGLHLRDLAVADLNTRVVHLGGTAHACADEAADERAHQRQRHDLAGKTAAALFLRAAAGILIPRVLGVVLRVDRGVGVLLVALAIAVVIQVVFVFVHDDDLLWTETLACSLFAFDGVIIGHIYVYFLNAI